jgi:hypothetical protein
MQKYGLPQAERIAKAQRLSTALDNALAIMPEAKRDEFFLPFNEIRKELL